MHIKSIIVHFMQKGPRADVDEGVRMLLMQEDIRGQVELLARLKERGFSITQSTLSRKLNKIGAYKEAGVYRLPGVGTQQELKILQMDISPPNIILIRTLPGYGQALGFQIDLLKSENATEKDFSKVLGTVAGDDTVLVVGAEGANLPEIKKAFVRLWRL